MGTTTIILSAAVGLLIVLAAVACLDAFISRRLKDDLAGEVRSLEYQVMHLAVKLEEERERAARRRERWISAARQVEEMKGAVEDALELIAAYKLVGAAPSALGLQELRDDLSDFGHLMEAAPTSPIDLAERSEWGGFR